MTSIYGFKNSSVFYTLLRYIKDNYYEAITLKIAIKLYKINLFEIKQR